MAVTNRGSILISTANDIGSSLVDVIGGEGYTPNEWSKEINLCGIAASDIPTALDNIEESTPSGTDRGSISLDTANAVGAVLNKKYNTARGFKPSEWASAISFLEPLPERTASGAIANIQDGADKVPVKSWQVTLPANLSGYTEVNGTKNTGSGTPEIQYNANLGRTIYGGTADIVNGQGTDGYGYIVFDGSNDENWGGYSAYNGYYIGISDMKSGTRQDGVCNQLTCSKSTAQGQTNAFWLGVGNARFYVIGVYDSMGNTLEAFRAYLAENPLILVYPLANSTDFAFTPIDPIPETENGVNNFWSDEGDSSVVYRADIDSPDPSNLLGLSNSNNNIEEEGNI